MHLKCVKSVGGWGFAPDPTGGSLRRSPDPLVDAPPDPHPLQNARAEGASVLVPDSSKENLATLVSTQKILMTWARRRIWRRTN
jgi:hypothetical protein